MLTSFTRTRQILAQLGVSYITDPQLEALVEAVGEESSEEYYAYLESQPEPTYPEGVYIEYDVGPEPELDVEP